MIYFFLESGLVAPSMKQNVRTHVASCLAIHFQKYLVGRVSCNKLRALIISKTVGIYIIYIYILATTASVFGNDPILIAFSMFLMFSNDIFSKQILPIHLVGIWYYHC